MKKCFPVITSFSSSVGFGIMVSSSFNGFGMMIARSGYNQSCSMRVALYSTGSNPSVKNGSNCQNDQTSGRRLKVFIPFLLLIPPLLVFYIICLKLGGLSVFLYVLSKGAGLAGGKALSFILTKMGCSSTLAFLIGSAFRTLVTMEARPSLAHCMLPGSSQQPAAGEEVPQDALRDHPVATRSAPPGDIEVKQPLMGDHEREMELQDRLNRHFIGTEVDRMRYIDLIDKQVLIEKRIEMALLSEIYTRERILANRYDIRECLFYKNGAPLKESTLDLYLKEIQNDLRGSVPFRKIENEIRNYNLFFSK